MTEPSTEIPLICDTRPGFYIISVQGRISVELADRIQRHFTESLTRDGPRVLVLDDRVTFHEVRPPLVWPDAEHCAA